MEHPNTPSRKGADGPSTDSAFPGCNCPPGVGTLERELSPGDTARSQTDQRKAMLALLAASPVGKVTVFPSSLPPSQV